MRELRLVGLSADGRNVLFLDDDGTEFTARADDRLRAALRGDRARLGQLEIQMDSALRPRDIQARIRSGDSPEDVAALAQVPVERVMPFCIPVLAERRHIADLAIRSHVRRRGSETASRELGEVVSERLRARGVDPRLADWDAWRRDDGRWEVQVSYTSGESHRSGLFIFDAVGRYSLPEDDEAKWLTGEPQSTSKGPQPRESGRGSDRRLSAVPDDDLLSIGDDDSDLTAVARAVSEDEPADEPADEPQTEDDSAGEDPPAPEPTDDDPVAGVAAREAESPSAHGSDGEEEGDKPAISSFLDQALNRHHKPPAEAASPAVKGNAGAPTEPTPSRKRRTKRASVPSWDEIMFGKDDPGAPGE